MATSRERLGHRQLHTLYQPIGPGAERNLRNQGFQHNLGKLQLFGRAFPAFAVKLRLEKLLED